MALTTIVAGNSVPLILQAGEVILLTLAANSSGNVSVPGQTVSTGVTAGGAYPFGPYTAQREVIVTLTAGTATADFSGDASGGLTSSQVAWVQSGGGRATGVTNYDALRPFFNAIGDVLNGPVLVNYVGDSTVFGLYSDGSGTASDTNQAAFSGATQLMQRMSAAYGTVQTFSIDPQDNRVTASSANPVLSVGLNGRARQVTSTGPGTITVTTPACTSIRIHYFESSAANGNTLSGTWSYNIDGAGAVAVPNAGAAASYKTVTVTGLANTAHSIVFTAGSAAPGYICSVDCWTTGGILVSRHGVGGYTSADILGEGTNSNQSAAGRVRLLGAFSQGNAPLTIIQCGHNDCTLQVTQGTTPAVYAANLARMAAQCATHGGAVLLVSNPDPNNSDASLTYKYRDYWPAARALAVPGSNIAHLAIADFWGSFTQAKASGYCDDTSGVHPLRKGYGALAGIMASVLSGADPYRSQLATGQ